MKKDLHNAMTKKFQTMVTSPEDETPVIDNEEASLNEELTGVSESTVINIIQPDTPAATVTTITNAPTAPVTPVPVAPAAPEPVQTTKAATPEPVPASPTPLTPGEKSSGVLHIRLGEMRSYVDFRVQSGKTTYQQYISDLIQADYERNKEHYLKYKEFMDQFM